MVQILTIKAYNFCNIEFLEISQNHIPSGSLCVRPVSSSTHCFVQLELYERVRCHNLSKTDRRSCDLRFELFQNRRIVR